MLRELLVSFGFDFDEAAVQAADAKINGLASELGALRSQGGITGNEIDGLTAGLRALSGNAQGAEDEMSQAAKAAEAMGKGMASISTPVKRAEKSTGGFTKALKVLAGVVGGGVLLSKLHDFVFGTLEAADALAKESDQLGIAIGKFQLLQQAAQRAGASNEELRIALKATAKNADTAAKGTGPIAEAFKQLGVNVQNADGSLRAVDEIFLEAGGALGDLEDSTKRAALAQQVLGEASLKVLPLFKDGEQGARDLLDQLEALGGGFSEEFARDAEAANDAIADFKFASVGLGSQILLGLLPALTKGARAVIGMIGSFNRTIKGTNLLKATLVVLAAVAIGAVQKMAVVYGAKLLLIGKAFLRTFLPLAALILIVDDLITLFEGGDSAIGALIDSIFGVGASKEFVELLKNAFAELIDFIGDVGEVAKLVFALFGDDSEAAKARLLEIWESFKDDMALLWEGVKDLAVAAWEGIRDFASNIIQEMIAGFLAKVSSAGQAISEFFGGGPGEAAATVGGGPAAGGTRSVQAPSGITNQASTVNQQNRTVINVDARGAAQPREVGREVAKAVTPARRGQNAAALGALVQR